MANNPGEKKLDERRQFVRLSILADVAYNKKDTSEKEKVSFTKNIGEGGICLITYEEVKVSDVLELKIALPEEKAPINILGKVVWVKKFSIGDTFQGERFDVGVEFINISAGDKQKIDKYVFVHKIVKE